MHHLFTMHCTSSFATASRFGGAMPTASFCGRLRGEFLNATALLCGSRLGRGLIRPGGVGFDLDAHVRAE